MAQSSSVRGLYLPALDGLRFLAFSLVLVHHLPPFAPSALMGALNAYGWVGVELFFVISSFLFFHLLDAEREKAGQISVSGFYARRILRIYPLMVAFPAFMLYLYGSADDQGLYRLIGIAAFADNLIAWVAGYNASIPFSAHLWTLSYEFQIYLIIPVAYTAYASMGRRNFTYAVIAVSAICLMLRIVFFGLNAPHPVIWVTPFLRPESILVGLLLSIYRPNWNWTISLLVAIVCAAIFFEINQPWQDGFANVAQYPLAALMCGAVVDFSLKCRGAGRILSAPILVGLGTISFGMYVFHFWAIRLSGLSLAKIVDINQIGNSAVVYAANVVLTVLICVGLATASYFALETPFQKLRRRFSVVDGRAKLKATQAEQGL